ncbi:hypothetical protein V5E97_31980 [Singulisphaera sp. Ch08]|uniref:Uncharacterized protein n=1 Tax=Singulisphaera sp. Ch08 TaxID=3120278 RepID=A0AAU7CCN1_9BACT
MQDEFFIDEQGRFQMATDDLTAFMEFLQANKILCSAEEPSAFTAEGRTYGYGRLHHLYDAEAAEDLHRHWNRDREESRTSQPQRS